MDPQLQIKESLNLPEQTVQCLSPAQLWICSYKKDKIQIMDLDAHKLLGIQYFWIQFFYPEPTPNYLYKTSLNLLVWVFLMCAHL